MESLIPPILVLSAILNLFIGVLIRLQGYKGVFIFAIIGLAFWDLSIFLFYLNIADQINWAIPAHFFAGIVAISFYLFSLKFPRETSLKARKFLIRSLPILFFVALSAVTFFTDLIVGEVNYETHSYVIGDYYLVYSLMLALYFNAGLVILFQQFRDAQSVVEKQQIRFVLIGALLVVVISMIVDIILPYLDNFAYIWVGPFSTILLVASVSFAILKYHLFSVKLIIVETALILLNFLLLSNAVLSKGGTILLLNSLLFLSIFILSIFLIRGIYKDIRDRERIEGLVKDMAVANKRLFALEQQKTEFVSIASHQLRTPMTVIKGYASMVLEGAFGVLPKEAKEAMEKLYKSSDKIVALVEDLLTVSRIEQGRGMPIFETINFVSFMQELLVPVALEMRDAGIKFSFDITKGSETSRVPLDKKKFEQALRHIIDNAIKYTKAPGSVKLTISNDTTQHRIYLSISDTGIGMTEEQVKALMEKSDIEASARKGATNHKEKEDGKIASSTSSQKASGIGFYIAQEIINAHYGSLRIESPGHNKGTTVIIELPELQ